MKWSIGLKTSLVVLALLYGKAFSACTKDLYENYSDLAEHERQCTGNTTGDCDYQIQASLMPSSDCLVMAIHGGYIEMYTNNLAETFGQLCNVYKFNGVKSSGNRQLHICSTHYDEPQLLEMVSKSSTCVSLHGMGSSTEKRICIGGGNKLMLGMIMSAAGKCSWLPFTVLDYTDPACSSYKGVNPDNVANRCSSEGGLQIELSLLLRKEMRANPGETLSEKLIRDLIATALFGVDFDCPKSSLQ